MRESDINVIAEIHRQIRAVLARDWDPIGVGAAPEVADEYCRYVRGAYDVAVETRSAQEVALHLLEIERDRMGMPPRSLRKVLPVGEEIVRLVSEISEP